MISLNRIFRLASIFNRKLQLLKLAQESETELSDEQKTLLGNIQTRIFNKVFDLKKYLDAQLEKSGPFVNLINIPPAKAKRFFPEAENAYNSAKEVMALIDELNNILKEDADNKDSEDYVGRVSVNNIYTDYISKILNIISELQNTEIGWASQGRDEYGNLYCFILNRETAHGYMGDPRDINQYKKEAIIKKVREMVVVFNKIVSTCNEIKKLMGRLSSENLIPQSVTDALISDPSVKVVQPPAMDIMPSEVEIMQREGLLMRPELFDTLPPEYRTSNKLLETVLHNEKEPESRSNFPDLSAAKLARHIKNALTTNPKVLTAKDYLKAVVSVVGREYTPVIISAFNMLNDSEKILCLGGGEQLPLNPEDRYKIPKPSRVSASNAIECFRSLIISKNYKTLLAENRELTEGLVRELNSKDSEVGDSIKNAIDSMPAGMGGKFTPELTAAKIEELKRRMEIIVPTVVEWYRKNQERARPLDDTAQPRKQKILPKAIEREPRELISDVLSGTRMLAFLQSKQLIDPIVQAVTSKLLSAKGNPELEFEIKSHFKEQLTLLETLEQSIPVWSEAIRSGVSILPEILTELDLN